ncbi:putative bifunctional diguanylate cyclase/phosphodiesterase [Thiobacter aerophilum]|uniref:EAL domain-containing protein n=1 Tax=Thiobacter aerophilum TaxID=3121275 RepID=A0ABV0EEL8_9BURK
MIHRDDPRVCDCLANDCARVGPEARYCDLAPEKRAQVLAVFDNDRYLGVVLARQAALFPNRIFADLLTATRQPPALAGDTPLEEALAQLEHGRYDCLPVIDTQGRFLGVVSASSLFRCLAQRERVARERLACAVQVLEEELVHHRMATAVFDTTSEGIMVTDADARILYVNRAFVETTGYTLEEVQGKSPHVLASGRHDAEFYRALWQQLKDTGHWSGEIWNRRKNGEIYPEYLHIDTIRDKEGRPYRYVGVFSDISDDRLIQRQLYELAFHDPLTGLANRALLRERLAAAVGQASRNGGRFAVVLLDLDRFKNVNDSLGHGAGDELLKQVGRRLEDLVRETDTVARMGGDEFTLLLCEQPDTASIKKIAPKILDAVRRPILVEGHELRVEASLGIAYFPEDGTDAETLLRHADTALYHAKAASGPGWARYEAGMGRRAKENLELETALRAALESGAGLHLAWQPQVRLADGRITGVEALARWIHPQLGPISPARFIPVVEQTGLAPAFGSWLIETFIADAERLLAALSDEHVRFALNVSPHNLHDDRFLRLLTDALRHLEILPDRIEVELTESSLMEDEGTQTHMLRALRDAGFGLAVDDFGSGYSNLAYLMRFAVDRLKIDMQFIAGLEHSAANRRLVEAMLRMADSLQMEVVAEGVERESQRQILLELGCQFAQGYLFAQPMAADELIRHLRGQALTA